MVAYTFYVSSKFDRCGSKITWPVFYLKFEPACLRLKYITSLKVRFTLCRFTRQRSDLQWVGFVLTSSMTLVNYLLITHQHVVF
jgi:hypothetical protein